MEEVFRMLEGYLLLTIHSVLTIVGALKVPVVLVLCCSWQGTVLGWHRVESCGQYISYLRRKIPHAYSFLLHLDFEDLSNPTNSP